MPSLGAGGVHNRGMTEVDDAAAAYLDHLEAERGLSAHTVSSYRRDLARYAEFCTARDILALDDVDEAAIGDFVADLGRGDSEHQPLAARSVARTVAAVRGLHRFALAEGWTAADPARTVAAPTPSRRLPKAIRLTEVEALIEAAGAEANPYAARDTALLELLYGTGVRVSEAIGLDLDDLDVEGRTVLVRGKGGKQRLLPVGRTALSAISDYLVRQRHH